MYKLVQAGFTPDDRLFAEIIRPGASLVKEAAAVHPDIQKCIADIKPTDGKMYILVNAMGAGEYYGANFNGDFFEENELCPPDGTSDYGYKTFLSAGVYRNHQNKDTEKSYGRVICAAYNKAMHRVELVIEIDRAKCIDVGHRDLWDRLQAGEKPAVSMGCKVAYDVCTICGKKSATRADYCEHVRDQLRQVLPDGRVVAVYNPRPRFFDLSIVVIGADRASYVMDKIAHAVGSSVVTSAELAEQAGVQSLSDVLASRLKVAAKGKSAEISKRIRAMAAKTIVAGEEPDLPADVIDGLSSERDLGKALTTSAAAGVVLKPEEFQRLVLLLLGKRDLADSLDRRQECFCPCHEVDTDVPFGERSQFSPKLLSLLTPFLGERSAFEPIVSRRLIIVKTAAKKKNRSYVSSPLLDKIAAAYNGYRVQLLEKIGSVVANITERDVHLLSAVRGELFEGGLVGRNRVTKTAAAPVPLALLGAIPLAYIYGAHTSGSGEQEKAADSFIAKHPVLAMSVLAGLARLAAKEAVETGLVGKALR